MNDTLRVEFRVAQSGMGWKGIQSQDVVTLEGSRVKWAQWLRVARGFQLRIGLSDHTREKFDGFLREVSQKVTCVVHVSQIATGTR
jgi:structure-specific recognition protein 1